MKIKEGKFTVVIPAYNEESGIRKTIEKVKKYTSDIIVVDDGSTDLTAKIAKRCKVKLIKHKTNMGYGAALKTGFKASKSKYIGFLDADLTYDPKFFPIFFKYLEMNKEIEMVIGNRFGNIRNDLGFVRHWVNSIFNMILSLITMRRIYDCSSGERMLRKNMLEKIDFETLPNDLNFTPALTKRAVVRGIQIVEIPIRVYYKKRAGKSKLKFLKHGIKFLKSIIFER